MCFVILLLLIYVKRTQIKRAVFAILVSQLFSWSLTLLYVLLGLQKNPVRLFPHATDSNFLFSFILHPTVFAVYYLHFPKNRKPGWRFFYTAIITSLLILFHLIMSLYTNLIEYSHKSILIPSLLIIFIIYNVSRKYIDWFFRKSFSLMETD
jgi:hypothetical protein